MAKKKETVRSIRAKLGKLGYDPVEKLVVALSGLEEDIKNAPKNSRASLRRIQVEALVQLSKVAYMSASDERYLEEDEDGVAPLRPILVVKSVGSC